MHPSGSGKAAALSIASTMQSTRNGVMKLSVVKLPSRPTSAASRSESSLEVMLSPTRKSPSPPMDEQPSSPVAHYTVPRAAARSMTTQRSDDNAAAIDCFDGAFAALSADYPLQQFRPCFEMPLDSTDPMFLLEWSWQRAVTSCHMQLVSELKKHLPIASDSELQRVFDAIQMLVGGLRSGKLVWNAPETDPAVEEPGILASLSYSLGELWSQKLQTVWRCALVHFPRKEQKS